MATPAIQTLLADAQQVLNLNSLSEVRATMAAALANANVGTPLNPNLTTQQLWDEFYLIVRQPESDIESIITNQLMKFLYAPPAPNGVAGNKRVIFNDNGVLATDKDLTYDKATDTLYVDGTATLASATITGDLTVDTNVLKVDTTNNVVGINNASPLTGTDGGLTLGVIGSSKAMAISMFNCFARLRERDAVNNFAITTNIDTTNAVLDDNTRTSWKVRFGSGNDNFLIQRAAIGSTTFQDLYSISTTSAAWYDGAGGTRMTLNSTGLGVGVASPTSKLTIGTGSFSAAASGTTGMYTTASGLEILSDSYFFGNRTGGGLMTLNSSGNVGIGVTPSAWISAVKALQISSYGSVAGSSSNFNILGNLYSSPSGTAYVGNGLGTLLQMTGGQYVFYQAPNNTLGAGASATLNPSMTLDASGNLLVGQTSASGTTVGCYLSAGGQFNAATANQDNLNIYNTTAAAYRFYVNSSGTVFATNTTISAISDARLKENVQDLDVGLNEVLALKPRKFDWKAGKGKDIKGDRGFIAQEFETVFPNLIDEWKDEAPEGEAPYKSVRADLIPVLVKAIQELTARVQTLEAK